MKKVLAMILTLSIFHAITALLVGLCFLGFGLTQTHNGKDGLADEVD